MRHVPIRGLRQRLNVASALLAVVVGIALAPQRADSQSSAGTWAEKARLGEQRTEAGVVAVNGRIYVMGGMAGTADSSPLTQEYDPATDRWRTRAPMPGPLSHPGAAVLDGRIYVVGGERCRRSAARAGRSAWSR